MRGGTASKSTGGPVPGRCWSHHSMRRQARDSAACNSVVNKLGSRVEVSLKFKPIAQFAAGMRAMVLLAADPNPTRHGAPKAKRVSRKSA